MFESMLLERARADRHHIVLPEGDDERILRAVSTLISRQVVDLTLLGSRIGGAGEGRCGRASTSATLRVVDPRSSELLEPFALEYTRLRAHKGMTLNVPATSSSTSRTSAR